MVRKQVAFIKQYRELILKGTFYRLLNPFESNITAWMVVSEDQKNAIVCYYKVLNEVNSRYRKLQLKGLDAGTGYHIDALNNTFSGSELMNIGMITTDYSAGEDSGVDEFGTDFGSKLYILIGK